MPKNNRWTTKSLQSAHLSETSRKSVAKQCGEVSSGVAGKVKRKKVVKLITPLPPSTYDVTLGSAVIVLPLPDKKLHPNARCSWRAKLAPKRLCREEAAYATVQALHSTRPLWPKASLHISAYLTTRAHADKDNIVAWLKHTIDGICTGGLVANDHGIAAPTVDILADRTCPRIELRFTRIEP